MRHAILPFLALLTMGTYAQPGTWDPSFGNNGKVIVPQLGAGEDDQSVTAVVLPDDRILVAGRTSNGTYFNSVLLRFNADGSPDATFGANGVVQHDLAAGSEFIRSAELDDQGRLVVGGHLFSDAAETNSDMFVARFLADGSLDPSFNGTGILVRDMHNTPDAEEAYEVLIQPDGKIVLCGFSGPSTEFTEIVVERYLDNGGPDATFGGDGSVLVGIFGATGEQLRGAVLGADGGIYFSGFAYPTGVTDQSLLLGHVDATGNNPSSFGNANGHSRVEISGSDLIGRTVATLPGGGFAVAGVQRTSGLTQARIIYTFDASGDVIVNAFHDSSDGADGWNSLLVQNNGLIISGGEVADGPSSRNWNVERKQSNLTNNGAFQAADYDEDGGEETCFDLAFTNDSAIIGIGYAEVAGHNRIVLIKYLNDISSGLAEEANSTMIGVFPNPVTDRAIIRLGAGSTGAVRCELLDATGRSVRNWTLPVTGDALIQADLGALLPGAYTLHVDNGLVRSAVKLLKR
ncbi:MAG: hypothetical protein IT228_00580 [Flavobacteriales bacterium]|nr:hypothetical protein [Flavobacteriales bacterium]MCC6575815.1 hypothetical protein [Flavobacteriales bacterium]NUQ13944.1 hypothetical protein [Flavobacteriales bacterium]